MPQLQLPIFPVGSTNITPELAFERRNHSVTYFYGHLPVFTHEVDDIASFRMYTTQLIVNGLATQGQIERAFGIPRVTIKRCVKRYREGGVGAFFVPRSKRRGNKLTPERLVEVQALLDQGLGVPAIHKQSGILATTLHKAIDDGRLRQTGKKTARLSLRRPPLRARQKRSLRAARASVA